MNVKEYLKPTTIEEAYEVGQMPGSIYVSGGLMVAQLKVSRIEHLIDLKSTGLAGIEDSKNEIKIEANTKISSLLFNDTVSHIYDHFFQDSLKEIGSVQIRNMATVGGSIAFKLGWSDITTIFMTVDSDVEIYDGSFKRIPLEKYVSEKHRGSIITALYIPKKNGLVAFEKFSRSIFDIATLNLGLKLVLDEDFVKEAKIIVGSRPMISERIPEVENFLIGKKPMDALDDAGKLIEKTVKVGTDIRAGADYRKALAGALLKKAMRRIYDEG